MPRIKDYTPQQSAPGPVDVHATANDFGAQAYQGLANLGSGLEDTGNFLEKRAAQANVSHLNAGLSKLSADQTLAVSEAIRKGDPSDPDIVDKIMKGYDDSSAKLEDSITTPGGRNFFERSNQQLRKNILESAMHGRAELADIQQKQNTVSSINNLSAATRINPPDYDSRVAQLESGIDAQVDAPGGMDRGKAIQLKAHGTAEIAKSAIMGWADVNPAAAKAQLDSAKFNNVFSEEQRQYLDGHIVMAENAQRIRAERIAKANSDVLAKQQVATQNDFMSQWRAGTLTEDKILNSNLDPEGAGGKKDFLNMLDAGARDKVNYTDPKVARHVYDLITRPDGDPEKMTNENDLNKYVINGTIGAHDVDSIFRPLIQGRRTQEGKDDAKFQDGVMRNAKAILDPKSSSLTGFSDPDGAARLQAFSTWFLPEWEKQRKAGVSAVDLADPRSSKSLMKGILNFQPTNSEIQQAVIRNMKGKATGWNLPENPGTQFGPVANPVSAGSPPVPPPPSKNNHPDKTQSGHIYRWNEATGKYE